MFNPNSNPNLNRNCKRKSVILIGPILSAKSYSIGQQTILGDKPSRRQTTDWATDHLGDRFGRVGDSR